MRVTTWFAEAGTLAARRDWTIECAATGRRLGAATSTWLAFNLDTRRMARLPPALRTYFQTASPQPPRWALGEAFAAEKCAEVAADAPCVVASRQHVRRSDLDMNRHVNNASYLEWIMDDIPPAVFDTAFMSGVDLEYRSECKYGDEVLCRAALVQRDGSCLLPGDAAVGPLPRAFEHALLRGADGVELLRARTQWRTRDEAPPPPPDDAAAVGR